MAPKISISSPLEAGTSLLDSHNLSAAITEALDYVSARLIRKRFHLTLILTQDDVTLPMAPTTHSPCIPQSPRSPMSPLSPVANFFRRKAPSPIQEIPTPISATPISATAWPSSPLTPRSPMTPGGLFSHPITISNSRHSRNRSLPTTPRVPSSPRQLPSPRQPPSPFLRPDYNNSQRSDSSCSSDSSGSTTSTNSATSTKCSIKLIPAILLSQRDGMVLQESLAKASHRHGVTMELSTTSTNLIHRSLQQNRLIHSSEGLTVLALDRIYTLKLAIARYTYLSSAASIRSIPVASNDIRESLAEAVDEVRLTVWAQQGAGIEKSLLLRSYDHLSISIQALREINAAYTAVTSKSAPILGIEAPSPPPLASTTPQGRPSVPEAIPRQPRRWNTTKEGGEIKENARREPMVKVMHQAKLDAAEKKRTAQLWLDSKPMAQPQTHLQNARQRLHRPALPRLNTAERKKLAEVPTPIEEVKISRLHSFRRNDGAIHKGRQTSTANGDFTPITRNEWSFYIGDQEPKKGGVEVTEAPAMTPVVSNDDNEGVEIRDLFEAITSVRHDDSAASGPAPRAVLQNARSRLNKPLLTRLNTEMEKKRNSKLAQPESPVVGKEIKRLHSFRGMVKRMDSLVDKRGPKTPGGWEDCTPITKNEWSFFIGEQAPKIAAVETC